MSNISLLMNTDLFTLDVDAYAHGCNVMGVMGAGIAAQFHGRYPEMFKAYAKLCHDNQYTEVLCGGVMHWEASKPQIFNLFTQRYTGRQARYSYVESAFATMFDLAKKLEMKTIAMPQIGCGIGGLIWEDVELLLIQQHKYSKWDGDVFVAIR